MRLPDRSELARFADTHARVGIQPGWGLTIALPEAVGLRRARQMSATGNFVDARTALAWGLVNHVVPHAELLGFTAQLAADAASNDPAAVQAIFTTYREVSHVTGAEPRPGAARACAVAFRWDRSRPGRPPPRGRYRARPSTGPLRTCT